MATFGKWRFECDPEATRVVYSRVDRGGAESCSCNGCRNFVAARSRVFPETFLELLATLGVDPLKDAEAYHNARLAPGRHDYGGWYHFIGQLTVDGDFAAVDFGNGFTASLCKATAPRLKSLEGLPVVQLEFHSESVPWALPEPEPM
jgi:hypothetical protein